MMLFTQRNPCFSYVLISYSPTAAGVQKIVDSLGIVLEIAYGKTKLFIKEPSTLVHLEKSREDAIPRLVARIQARYRGVLCRRRVRKIRAVYRIIAYWHAAHVRSYLRSLCATFEGVAERPDLGKALAFPAPPSGLNTFAVSCKRIYAVWRARKILARYSPEQKVELQQKMLAADLLGGRRPYWCVRSRGSERSGLGKRGGGDIEKTHTHTERRERAKGIGKKRMGEEVNVEPERQTQTQRESKKRRKENERKRAKETCQLSFTRVHAFFREGYSCFRCGVLCCVHHVV